MRSARFVLMGLLGIPAPAPAQTPTQPTVVLTILAGAGAGHGLWQVPKQPRQVEGTSTYDTLAIGRSIGSSLILGASGTYFVTRNVGLHAELSYLGLPLDSSCRLQPPEQPDFEHKNQQMCDNLHAAQGAGGAIAIFAGVTLRTGSQRSFSPYVRGSVGIVNASRSTVEVVSFYSDGTGIHERELITDPSPRHRSVMAGFAAGFTTPLGPGYQARIEVRDIVTSLERLTGPASDLGVPQVGSRSYHHIALVLGFDIVLERTRGRRY